MKGEKLPLLVIGKAENPRCFKKAGPERFNCEYLSSPKSWMTTELFNHYLLKLNNDMKAQKREILLFIDNAPVHKVPEVTKRKLSHVKVQFFPANMTSVVQPLDAGIIRSFKSSARRYTIRKIRSLMDQQPTQQASFFAKSLSLLDAIISATTAWSEVTKQTIENCFRKC